MFVTHGVRARELVLAGRSLSILFVGLLAIGCQRSAAQRVVLYCAQDREFAERILGDFSRQGGPTVAPKYDTEADKSVGLFNELAREKNRPRCDVFWNNEILNTIRLQRMGLLEPYDSPAAIPYPAFARSADRTWTAFAARARVLIVNTGLVSDAERPKSLLDLTGPKWKGKVAIAKPLFGTTATQAACLFEVIGKERAKAFYAGLHENGVHVVPGNKQVAEAVARGRVPLGLTDTDDAIIELEAGRPVTLVYPDRDGHPEFPRLGTLFIPNTLMLIRGSPNLEGGRKLIDFLLSSEVEKRLAESSSRQIPLNPTVAADLPSVIERPRGGGGTVKPMEPDFSRAADLWDEVQAFLRNEFARD